MDSKTFFFFFFTNLLYIAHACIDLHQRKISHEQYPTFVGENAVCRDVA